MQLPYGLWNGHIDPDLVANRVYSQIHAFPENRR